MGEPTNTEWRNVKAGGSWRKKTNMGPARLTERTFFPSLPSLQAYWLSLSEAIWRPRCPSYETLQTLEAMRPVVRTGPSISSLSSSVNGTRGSEILQTDLWPVVWIRQKEVGLNSELLIVSVNFFQLGRGLSIHARLVLFFPHQV